MFTISKLAKLAGVTEKAIRLYEKNGLLTSGIRSSNNYRYFTETHLTELKKIVALKSLGLSLRDIKSIILHSEENAESNLNDFYIEQMKKTEKELLTLEKRKHELSQKIYVTEKIIGNQKRGQMTMEKVISKNVTRDLSELLKLKEVALAKYKQHGPEVEAFIEREQFFDSEEKIQFINDVKTILQYLNERKIKIGPLRGSASSSLILDVLGLNSINPLKYGLVPERFSKEKLFLDMDVEFSKGDEFIWFCKELTCNRPYKFEAYKLPLLDILELTQKRINKTIDWETVPDLDESMKHFIKTGDVEYIPYFYIPENTFVNKFWMQYQPLNNETLISNIKKLNPENIRDIWGYVSLEGRDSTLAKLNQFLNNVPYDDFENLPEFEKHILSQNRGHLLYQEEWITILARYINNNFNLAEQTRRDFNKIGKTVLDKFDICDSVKRLLSHEFKSLYNFSHTASVWQQCKMAAYLKYHHREIYLDEIKKFEEINPNYSWADFGFKVPGVILMQS